MLFYNHESLSLHSGHSIIEPDDAALSEFAWYCKLELMSNLINVLSNSYELMRLLKRRQVIMFVQEVL